jgi:hypothetical protein
MTPNLDFDAAKVPQSSRHNHRREQLVRRLGALSVDFAAVSWQVGNPG